MLRPLLRPLLSQEVDAANTPIETALTEEQRKKATEHPGGLKSLAAFRGLGRSSWRLCGEAAVL